MFKLQVLWVDATLCVKDGEMPPTFRQYCDTFYCSGAEQMEELIKRNAMDVVCFDFDYPDRAGLRLLRDTKARYASLPIVMLTVQHSESLAIWAFRSKVWDYLVKPVPKHEAERCLSSLVRALGHRREQSPRAAACQPERIPDEVSYVPKPENAFLAPAIYYVEQNFRCRVRSEDVAALCGVSPFRFSRLFRDTFGITFRDYLIGYRLKEACRLLENPVASVADVAFAVGFSDPSYFARIFKQRMGKAPSQVVGQRLPNMQQAGERLGCELPKLVL